MSATKIFLTGASGYIGGSVLHALLESPNAAKYSISVLLRSPDHVAKVEALGVRVVEGSLEDLDLLEKEAADADIVIHAASALLLAPGKSLAAGLAKRKAQGKPAYLIHTSGSSIVADAAKGEFLGTKVYADTDDMYSFEKSAPHYELRELDVALIDAGEQGSFGVAIIPPPTIYGTGTGPLKRTTIQVRAMIAAAVKTRQTNYIGAGVPSWSHVHIEDLASLYRLLVDAVREGRAPSGKEGYLFPETGEHTWKELAEALAPVLHAKGVVDSPKATPWVSEEQAADALIEGSLYFARIAFASNSRIRGVRSREALGWKPVHTEKDFLRTLDEQATFLLSEN